VISGYWPLSFGPVGWTATTGNPRVVPVPVPWGGFLVNLRDRSSGRDPIVAYLAPGSSVPALVIPDPPLGSERGTGCLVFALSGPADRAVAALEWGLVDRCTGTARPANRRFGPTVTYEECFPRPDVDVTVARPFGAEGRILYLVAGVPAHHTYVVVDDRATGRHAALSIPRTAFYPSEGAVSADGQTVLLLNETGFLVVDNPLEL
jgi:hypothetical protein